MQKGASAPFLLEWSRKPPIFYNFPYNRLMKTILIDAEKIMQSEKPLNTLGQAFQVQAETEEELSLALQGLKEYLVCAVENWKGQPKEWQLLGDLLEGVQKHSDTFFLIWGADEDYVNAHAVDVQDLLENPPAEA